MHTLVVRQCGGPSLSRLNNLANYNSYFQHDTVWFACFVLLIILKGINAFLIFLNILIWTWTMEQHVYGLMAGPSDTFTVQDHLRMNNRTYLLCKCSLIKTHSLQPWTNNFHKISLSFKIIYEIISHKKIAWLNVNSTTYNYNKLWIFLTFGEVCQK